MLDPAGVPVVQQIAVPVATQGLVLGVRTDEAADPAATPKFEAVIALSPDGSRQDKPGIGWEVVREDAAPSWSWSGGRFAFRPAVRDSHVAGGTVDIPADMPATVATTLPAAHYRLEVFDPDGEARSSTRFQVGWSPPLPGAAADRVQVRPAKPVATPGQPAEIALKAPYYFDVLLVTADAQIRAVATLHVPAAGATVRPDVPADLGPALNVAAFAFAGPDAGRPRCRAAPSRRPCCRGTPRRAASPSS